MNDPTDPPITDDELAEAEAAQRRFAKRTGAARTDSASAPIAPPMPPSDIRKSNGDVWRMGRHPDPNLVDVLRRDGSVCTIDLTPR